MRYALEFAKSHGAEVIVYNVITPDETPFPQAEEKWLVKQLDLPKIRKTIEERQRRLAEFMQNNFAEYLAAMKIRQDVAIGTPYKQIVEKAAQEEVDMIVLCTHGRTGLLHMLIGSVTEQVVRRAPCAVLSVPPRATARKPSRAQG
jgi:nucleotide-binding universal stress UspA family protein